MTAHLLKTVKPAPMTYCGRPYNSKATGSICERCLHAAIVGSKPAPPSTGQIKPSETRRSAA